MKVFISHAFGGADEPLANTLKDDLAAAGIDGYLAEKTPRYDLPISDKIRQEIDASDWLVAVITGRSHASASVHEEIGYAFGKDVRVALMVEEGVETAGVFAYGREYERFRAPEFGKHSRKMARHVASSPRPAPRRLPVDEGVDALLESRNILSDESPSFAQNEYFSHLHSPLPDNKKPVVLFTSCPNHMGGNADVAAQKFKGWVESTSSVTVDGQQARILGFKTRVDIGRLVAVELHPRAPAVKTALAYREFRSTGFFEFGTSCLFFDRNSRGKMEMHLCYMVGEFWSFLAQARLFYLTTGLDFPFAAIMSIRNSDLVHLGNYGDEVLPRRLGGRLAAGPSISPTHRKNISLRYDFKSVRGATDEEIARAAKEMAKQVCNAYGETTPRCYNEDGSFSWGLWHCVARNAARGDRT